jgi:hypothetical protein
MRRIKIIIILLFNYYFNLLSNNFFLQWFHVFFLMFNLRKDLRWSFILL